MGRKRLVVKPIENAVARQAMYAKRKEGVFKKANELAILCDTDVALIMFSPTGNVNSFASNGRSSITIEDIFIRFVDRPDELRGGPLAKEAYLSEKLKQLKYEEAMLEKIAVVEDLEEKLDKITRRQREARDKLRFYEPNLENIKTPLEAGVAQQFLASAIQRIQLAKAKLLGNEVVPKRVTNNTKENMVNGHGAEAAASITNAVPYLNHNMMHFMRGKDQMFGASSTSHLNFFDSQNQQKNFTQY